MTSVKSPPEMECLIRLAWDWLYSPDPLHFNWRFQNFKSLMPMLKTGPFDWLNYDVSLYFNPFLTHSQYIIHQPKFVLYGPSTWDILYIPLYHNHSELVLCDSIGHSFLKWCGKLPSGTLPRRRAPLSDC